MRNRVKKAVAQVISDTDKITMRKIERTQSGVPGGYLSVVGSSWIDLQTGETSPIKISTKQM